VKERETIGMQITIKAMYLIAIKEEMKGNFCPKHMGVGC
jgi:hypothetical protein